MAFFAACIDKVQRKICAYDDQIDEVKHYNVVQLMIYHFADNSGDISDDDRNDKDDAFALC